MKNFLATTLMLALACASISAQWQKLDVPFQPIAISAIDSNTLWCFNYNTGDIARTIDGGTTWQLQDIPNAQGFLLGSFISAINANSAWVAFNHYDSGIKYVYQTFDGGQSWQSRKPGSMLNSHSINFQKFYTIDKGIILCQDFNGHVIVYRTANGGQSWTSKTLNINGSYLNTATHGDKNIWFYTGSGELWRSYDGGETWSKFQTSIIATSYGLKMEFADSLNGLAFKDSYFDQLYRTADGGASWQPLTNPNNPPRPHTFVWGITKVPEFPHAWVIGYNDGTTYSLDDGNNWYAEANYPDYDFRKPDFLNQRQGWGIASSSMAVFKWQGVVGAAPNACIQFLGPLSGKLRRADCDNIWFQGSIRVNIENDPGLHLRAKLFYPDNTNFPATQKQIYNNLLTSCPSCPFNFVPDSGQTTLGQLHFDILVNYAFDTAQAVICTVSPTLCANDSSNAFQFHTGYFANWFHPECFRVDTVDCAIQLQTNVCGIDTNHYTIYYQVGGGPAVLGNRFEGISPLNKKIFFYIFADGDIQTSTCYEVIDTSLTCGISGTFMPALSKAVALRIAPNPATNSFQVFCDKLPEGPPNEIQIKNAAGVLVWRQAFPQGAPSIFVENYDFPAGFYITELWSGNKLMALEKLVVAKNK